MFLTSGHSSTKSMLIEEFGTDDFDQIQEEIGYFDGVEDMDAYAMAMECDNIIGDLVNDQIILETKVKLGESNVDILKEEANVVRKVVEWFKKLGRKIGLWVRKWIAKTMQWFNKTQKFYKENIKKFDEDKYEVKNKTESNKTEVSISKHFKNSVSGLFEISKEASDLISDIEKANSDSELDDQEKAMDEVSENLTDSEKVKLIEISSKWDKKTTYGNFKKADRDAQKQIDNTYKEVRKILDDCEKEVNNSSDDDRSDVIKVQRRRAKYANKALTLCAKEVRVCIQDSKKIMGKAASQMKKQDKESGESGS